MNHFKKLYKAIVKNLLAKYTSFFEYYVRIFGSKAWEIIRYDMGRSVE